MFVQPVESTPDAVPSLLVCSTVSVRSIGVAVGVVGGLKVLLLLLLLLRVSKLSVSDSSRTAISCMNRSLEL